MKRPLPIKHWIVGTALNISLLAGCEAPQEANPQNNAKWPFSVAENKKTPKVKYTIDDLKERLVENYSEYWPLISLENQHEKLIQVLNDPLPELRVFGIERVGILLRDREATKEELQTVAFLLKDRETQVRRAAAKLLPETELSGLKEFVATALDDETDDEVAKAELQYFQTYPFNGAFETIINRIQNGTVIPAARAIIAMLNAGMVSTEQEKNLLHIVKKRRKLKDEEELITIEAMVGTTKDKNRLTDLLTSQNRTKQLAVAKGFAATGYSAPLIPFANDDEIYKLILLALQNKADINSFTSLIQLQKTNNNDWDAAAIAIASELDTGSLLQADDMLKRSGRDALRLRILKYIWQNANERTLSAKKAIARRTVPLLIEQSDSVGALQLLDSFGETLIDDDLLTLRFRAAIFAAAWDTAADAKPMLNPWIEMWLELQEEDGAIAEIIKQQIEQRFGSQLTSSQRALLGITEASNNVEVELEEG